MEVFKLNKEQYQELVKRITPKPKRLENAIIAFLVGGAIGVFGEIINKLLQIIFKLNSQDSIVWTVIIFILLATFFTALNFFDNWVAKVKAALIIPITGFAHSITSSALDYKKDGLITGLGSNFFKLAGSVLLYGIISGFTLALIKVIIYG